MLFLLLACAQPTPDTDAPAECTDLDGDGWCAGSPALSDSDCNDDEARAFPGAADCECDCDRSSGLCCNASGCNEAGCP
jgi:hypothetical protein